MKQIKFMMMYQRYLEMMYGRPVEEIEMATIWCKYCAKYFRDRLAQ